MCIKKSELLELNDVIQHLNAISDAYEREVYLQEAVEDVELFISTLRSINKSKLVATRKKKVTAIKSKEYTSDIVFKIFKENSLDEIVAKYTKQELTDMYAAIFLAKPLSSYDKIRIAQNIYHYINTLNRTKALLG